MLPHLGKARGLRGKIQESALRYARIANPAPASTGRIQHRRQVYPELSPCLTYGETVRSSTLGGQKTFREQVSGLISVFGVKNGTATHRGVRQIGPVADKVVITLAPDSSHRPIDEAHESAGNLLLRAHAISREC